jgi:hypothetical protein
MVAALALSGTLMLFDAVTRPARALTLCALTGGLIGCASDYRPPAQPSFYDSMAKPDVQLDAAAAASMISGYRRNNGLGAVSLDPQLMRMAETHAQTMASRDKLDHNVGGAFSQRVQRSGYDAKTAVENISAGYLGLRCQHLRACIAHPVSNDDDLPSSSCSGMKSAKPEAGSYWQRPSP